MHRYYRLALGLGLVPLITGVAIFALWWFTRWEWLMGAGGVTICAGLVALAAGLIALGWYFHLGFVDPAVRRQTLVLKTIACAAVMLFNLPVAAGIVVAVIQEESRYVVTILNESSLPLEQVRIEGGGRDVRLGSIPARGSEQSSLRFESDGQLVLSFEFDGQIRRTIVEGYVTGSQGGSSHVTIDAAGTIRVTKRHG